MTPGAFPQFNWQQMMAQPKSLPAFDPSTMRTPQGGQSIPGIGNPYRTLDLRSGGGKGSPGGGKGGGGGQLPPQMDFGRFKDWSPAPGSLGQRGGGDAMLPNQSSYTPMGPKPMPQMAMPGANNMADLLSQNIGVGQNQYQQMMAPQMNDRYENWLSPVRDMQRPMSMNQIMQERNPPPPPPPPPEPEPEPTATTQPATNPHARPVGMGEDLVNRGPFGGYNTAGEYVASQFGYGHPGTPLPPRGAGFISNPAVLQQIQGNALTTGPGVQPPPGGPSPMEVMRSRRGGGKFPGRFGGSW